MAQSYVPVRVSTLRGDLKIDFNLYVRVSNKYILFCRAGESFEGDRLKRLHDKKVPVMYIQSQDMPLYEKYIGENIRRAYDSASKKPIEERGEIIQGIMQGAAEDLIENLDDDVKYKLAIQGAKRFLEFIISDTEALRSILRVRNEGFQAAQHGIAVSALALAIADELGITRERPMQIDFLTVGCMIHDLEHQLTPFRHAYPESEISKAHDKLFAHHTSRGADRVLKSGFIDPLIEKIIRYNDERADGSGPYGMTQENLDPMVFIAATANTFDHYVSQQKIPAKDALKKMLVDKMGIYPLETLKALQGALKKRGLV